MGLGSLTGGKQRRGTAPIPGVRSDRSGGQSLAAFCPPALDDGLAGAGAHPGGEPVLALATPGVGLECALHRRVPLVARGAVAAVADSEASVAVKPRTRCREPELADQPRLDSVGTGPSLRKGASAERVPRCSAHLAASESGNLYSPTLRRRGSVIRPWAPSAASPRPCHQHVHRFPGAGGVSRPGACRHLGGSVRAARLSTIVEGAVDNAPPIDVPSCDSRATHAKENRCNTPPLWILTTCGRAPCQTFVSP